MSRETVGLGSVSVPKASGKPLLSASPSLCENCGSPRPRPRAGLCSSPHHFSHQGLFYILILPSLDLLQACGGGSGLPRSLSRVLATLSSPPRRGLLLEQNSGSLQGLHGREEEVPWERRSLSWQLEPVRKQMALPHRSHVTSWVNMSPPGPPRRGRAQGAERRLCTRPCAWPTSSLRQQRFRAAPITVGKAAAGFTCR